VRIRGGKVKLTWRARPIPGQKLQLLDRAQGTATKVQRLTAKHTGTITFAPANPLSTRRTIEADIFQNGMPRARIVVARYRLHPAKRPGRVTHAKATRG
jgi:hypothetical protein